MKEYIKSRIEELEVQKQKLIDTANQCMADASAVNGGIFELQQMLDTIAKKENEDKVEAAE